MMKIILATDGSQHAKDAAVLLAHLPHIESMELTVLVIANAPNLHGTMVDAEVMKQFEHAEHLRAQKIFHEIQNIFEGANVFLKLVVGQGHIGTAIVRQAESDQSDLVVVGAIGHSIFERMLGSISDFVATHAPCSVLIVRPSLPAMKRDCIKLCVAYDESESASKVVDQLTSFGWGPSTQIEIVSVVTVPFVYSEIPYEFDMEEIKASKVQAADQASKRLQYLSPNVSTHVIDANHVGDGIVEFANKHGSDIVVMGNTGMGLLGRFLIGSVSRYVLRHAKCSVWIVR
jgi:nucleotide-binding universal stress UspA family protein